MQIINSAPSVEIIILKTIIEAKIGQIGRRSNYAQIYLRYRGSNQIMINIDCNRTKGSFDYESL